MIEFNYIFQSLKSRKVKGTLREFYYGYLRVNHFLVLHKKLNNPLKESNLKENITIKKLALNELSEFRTSEKLPVEFSCDKFHGFKTPFVAFVDGKIAAIHWVVTNKEFSRFLQLSENDLELNYNTVLPIYRGHRLAELLMSKILEHYSGSRYQHMFGVVNAENIAQYKPMLRLGFEPVEVLTHFLTFRPKATLKYVKR